MVRALHQCVEHGGDWPVSYDSVGAGGNGRTAGDAWLDSWGAAGAVRWHGTGRVGVAYSRFRRFISLPATGFRPEVVWSADGVPLFVAVAADRADLDCIWRSGICGVRWGLSCDDADATQTSGNGTLFDQPCSAIPLDPLHRFLVHRRYRSCTCNLLLDYSERPDALPAFDGLRLSCRRFSSFPPVLFGAWLGHSDCGLRLWWLQQRLPAGWRGEDSSTQYSADCVALDLCGGH